MEKWVDIAGYEGLYQISSCGNVRSFVSARGKRKIPKLLKPEVLKKGYLRVPLCKDYSKERYMVHRLVAMAFIPNPDNLPYINHKDENKSNNNVDNLEWCSRSYNVRYSWDKHPERHTRKGKHYAHAIVQLDKAGNVIKEWTNARTIFVETGMDDSSIRQVCQGVRHSAYGYLWRYVI